MIQVNKLQEPLLNVLRIMAAFLWIPHGAGKLFGFLATDPWTAPELFSRLWFAGVIEFFGGTLILIGLFTRPVAFIAAGEMASAFFLAHLPRGFWPLKNQGELAALYCFVWLYIMASGGGSFSVDGWWKRRKKA